MKKKFFMTTNYIEITIFPCSHVLVLPARGGSKPGLFDLLSAAVRPEGLPARHAASPFGPPACLRSGWTSGEVLPSLATFELTMALRVCWAAWIRWVIIPFPTGISS